MGNENCETLHAMFSFLLSFSSTECVILKLCLCSELQYHHYCRWLSKGDGRLLLFALLATQFILYSKMQGLVYIFEMGRKLNALLVKLCYYIQQYMLLVKEKSNRVSSSLLRREKWGDSGWLFLPNLFIGKSLIPVFFSFWDKKKTTCRLSLISSRDAIMLRRLTANVSLHMPWLKSFALEEGRKC